MSAGNQLCETGMLQLDRRHIKGESEVKSCEVFAVKVLSDIECLDKFRFAKKFGLKYHHGRNLSDSGTTLWIKLGQKFFQEGFF